MLCRANNRTNFYHSLAHSFSTSHNNKKILQYFPVHSSRTNRDQIIIQGQIFSNPCGIQGFQTLNKSKVRLPNLFAFQSFRPSSPTAATRTANFSPPSALQVVLQPKGSKGEGPFNIPSTMLCFAIIIPSCCKHHCVGLTLFIFREVTPPS